MADLKQMFGFERSIVPIQDFAFRPLRDSTRRVFTQAQDHVTSSAMNFRILYSLKSGSFILMEYRGCHLIKQQQKNRTVEIWTSEWPPQGNLIPAEKAVGFLIENQFEVPANLDSVVQRIFIPQLPPQDRPLTYWEGKNLVQCMHSMPGHEIDAIDAASEVVRFGIELVQFLRATIKERVHGGRSAIYPFSERLFMSYAVDPDHWWGTQTEIPPAAVNITGLRWPNGFSRAIETLQNLRRRLEGPLVVSQRIRTAGGRPTLTEWKTGWNALVDAVPLLERDILALRNELVSLRKLDSQPGRKTMLHSPPEETPYLEIHLDEAKLKICRGEVAPQPLTPLLFAILRLLIKKRSEGASTREIDEVIKKTNHETSGRKSAIADLKRRLRPLDLGITDARRKPEKYILVEQVSNSGEDSDP